MSWLRRNRWYLVAVAVLAPAAALVALNAGYFGYLEDTAGRPIAVDGSETVSYAGADWSLLEWIVFGADTDAGQAAGLLPGTSLVSAIVGVRPDGTSEDGTGPDCTVELADASGQRAWDIPLSSAVDFDHRAGVLDYCDGDATEPYRFQTHFVVPDDAVPGARLRLWDWGAHPSLLVFTP